MSTKNSNTSQELFNLNGKPSFGQALPLAFQHVVAMIVGCVTPAIIFGGSSVVVTTILSIFLNTILPKDNGEETE